MIRAIEQHLSRIDEDSLLEMVALDPVHLEESLCGIEANLGGTINNVRNPRKA